MLNKTDWSSTTSQTTQWTWIIFVEKGSFKLNLLDLEEVIV
jgi:hypothetical protein